MKELKAVKKETDRQTIDGSDFEDLEERANF
ncbi:Cytochrome P450 4V2, partial [Araneus ventricosus]